MKRNVVFIIGAFLLGGLLLPNLHVSWRPPEGDAQTLTGLNVTPAAPPQGLDADEIYARAAQAVYKSVVNIDTTQRVRVRDFFSDDVFGGPRYRESQSEGSGVIITRDGYILTNEHVVGGRNEAGKHITVTMTDGRRLPGTVVGADHQTDVALVKIEGSNLPTAHIGTVRGLVPGQMAVAIGNPLGLRFTVSHGVISALGRPIQVQDRIYSDLIQHDALINPGNSGGALINLHGQVIGINTLVANAAQGIGFAIPIDTALRVADELKRYGKVKRPWLGIVVTSNNPYFVQRYGLPDAPGAVVRALYQDSPATEAGLEVGDVITKLGGDAIRSEDDYKAAEKKLRIGQRVEIEVQRQDGANRRAVTVGEAP